MSHHPWAGVLLGTLCIFALTASAVAQNAKKLDAKKAPAEALISADEKQIREAIVSFVERYNAHKADQIAALFATDARMTFANGTQVNGREEIKESFEEAFRESPKGAVSVVVDSIRFLTADVAVEEGATTMFPDGETLSSKGSYTVIHIKKEGRWLMQAVRVEKEESLSNYSELQALEWLVGEWIDEGRTENVEAKFHWDENKNFLLEDFQVVRDGAVVLKGTQRIGWDPQAKQIRSWIFDSAGGFGEANWSISGGEWICKAKGVSPDGATTTATRTLIKATNDRVVWSATDRTVGDEKLSDLDVTMVRKPPQPK